MRIEIIELCWTAAVPRSAIFAPLQHLCRCDTECQHTVRPGGFSLAAGRPRTFSRQSSDDRRGDTALVVNLNL